MKRLACRLLALYLNIRFIRDYLRGFVYEGHDFEDTDEVCGDHFIIRCKRCGTEVHSEVMVSKFPAMEDIEEGEA